MSLSSENDNFQFEENEDKNVIEFEDEEDKNEEEIVLNSCFCLDSVDFGEINRVKQPINGLFVYILILGTFIF